MFVSNKGESYTITSSDKTHVQRTMCVVWTTG